MEDTGAETEDPKHMSSPGIQEDTSTPQQANNDADPKTTPSQNVHEIVSKPGQEIKIEGESKKDRKHEAPGKNPPARKTRPQA